MYTPTIGNVNRDSVNAITFKEFAAFARRRRWTPESLAARFRGRIERAAEFFHRVLNGGQPNCVIPYRCVIDFFQAESRREAGAALLFSHSRLCACGCGEPAFDRKKWATPGCRTRARRARVTDKQKGDRQTLDFVEAKLRQNQGTAIKVLPGPKTGTNDG